MKEKYYKITYSLDSILKSASQSVKDVAVKAMDHYIAEYNKNKKIHNAESVAYGFMELIDFEIKETPVPNGEKISCKKGCASCCSINLDISKEEAILLIGHCKEENIKIDWGKLQIQSKCNHDTYFNLDKDLRKCVFLAKDNTCKVYKYRPISCRRCFSLDDPNKCNLDNGEQSVKRFVSPKAEFVACAVMTATEFKSLPSMLLKYKIIDK